jgi:diguanylate cyclase (GGDEF)-like protein/PAS domain S-box-containing protein
MLPRLSSWRYPAECALVATIAAVWIGLILTGSGGPALSQAVSNIGLAAVALAAAVAGSLAARRHRGRHRRVWALLAGSALSWGLGQVAWTWYESVLGREVPFPSLADVGYLGAVPLAAAALLALPTAAQTMAGRVRAVLDGLMIASSLLLTSWVVVLGPAVHAGGDGLLGQAISLAYPVGDVVVVTIVVYVLLRARQSKGTVVRLPLGLVGVGLVAMAVADSGFLYLTLTGAYSSGSLFDIGWFLGYGLILLAARKPVASATEDDGEAAEGRPLGLLLPYFAVAIGLASSSVELLRSGSAEPFVSWLRSLIIVLMVMRQILTMLENLSLTRHLEARVAERTTELRASQQRFQALVQHSSEVVTVVDRDSTVRYQSESVHRVFGYLATALLDNPLTSFLDQPSALRLNEALAQLAREPYGMRTLELTVFHRTGRACQVEMTITNLLENPSVQGLVLNTRDVTERKRLEEQLLHDAFHDSLTGLANRALFKDRVDRTLRRYNRRHPVAVLFLDLDGFKEVNDSLGHAAGDVLLGLVADRLRQGVRVDDTVARLGGDEFAVLVESAEDDPHAAAAAERISAALGAPFLVGGNEIHVRASVGIATADGGEDADQVLRNADLAMYKAKAAGEGRYVRYDPRMHSDLVERLELEADLRRALDGDELVLHYQPVVSLSSGEIVGVEALVRWAHPTRGLIFPAEFIPVAEDMGLVRPIGRWILREACLQAAAWRQDYPHMDPLTMSVNISVRQFQHGNLEQDVAGALELSGIAGEHVVLEMTESVLMEHTEENLGRLRGLRMLGVRLAIDDFGTGYSSLSYLHRFPVDILKIDRSFVDRLVGPSRDTELVRTIVHLGQSLRMVTVAEGIEDHNQFLALRRIGCELGQGYHFSRPAPAEEIAQLLSDSQLERPRALVA